MQRKRLSVLVSTSLPRASRIQSMPTKPQRIISPSFSVAVLISIATLHFSVRGPECLAQAVSSFGQGPSGSYLERIVPYVPTPQDVVEKMLVLAKVVPDDVVYDLGSGDGRIVITAAQKFGARAVGVELNPDLYTQSMARIKELGLEGRAQILHENMFNVTYRRATVVTLYLLTAVNEKLRPMLEKQLRPGARIVCHDFQVPGWDPEQAVEVISKNGISHKLYLYIRP
jgi:hypothetical protein